MQADSVPEALPSLTEQLRRFANGDCLFADEVLRIVYPELRRVALRALSHDASGALSATELIHEMWLRKLRHGGVHVESRQHFYAIAGFAMRQLLIELARQQQAARRGGRSLIVLPLDEEIHGVGPRTADPETVIQMGILMERLEKKNPEAARIVDLHHFVGFTFQEIAEISGLTFRQVRYLWDKGNNWIKDRLSD